MKSVYRIAWVWLTAASLSMGAAAAQKPADTNERLDRVEKIVSRLPRISGFVNFRYRYSDEAGSHNSFDVRRARLDFRGEIYRSADYRVQLELAGSPKILDAYLRWRPLRQLHIQAGQFKVPFSLENPYSPINLETIENSLVISQLSGYSDVSGISANGRDIGLSLSGGFFPRDGYNVLDYAVGIFNGNGINNTDNNGSKDFAGSLYLNPIQPITLSVSHYNGSVGRTVENDFINSRRIRSGAGFRYEDRSFLVRAEYIHGKTGEIKSEGWYGVVGYHVIPKVQPVFKYDYFQEDKSVRDTRRNHYTVGVNYTPASVLKFQLNYTYKALKATDNINFIAVQIFGIF